MNDKIYIYRIIKYLEKIDRYMKNTHTFQEFQLDEEKVDAVILNLEQIGETAKKLSNKFKEHNKEIDWPKLIGLRNIISHEYEGISIEIIYTILKEKLPDISTLLHTITDT